MRDSNVPDARVYASHLEEVHAKAREMLRRARESARKFADRKRVDLPAEGFNVGDMVLLDRRNIRTLRPARKLDDKYLGPFRIEEVVGDSGMAQRLKLPPSMKIHPTFHVRMLEPYRPNKLPERETVPPPPPITVDDVSRTDGVKGVR